MTTETSPKRRRLERQGGRRHAAPVRKPGKVPIKSWVPDSRAAPRAADQPVEPAVRDPSRRARPRTRVSKQLTRISVGVSSGLPASSAGHTEEGWQWE